MPKKGKKKSKTSDAPKAEGEEEEKQVSSDIFRIYCMIGSCQNFALVRLG